MNGINQQVDEKLGEENVESITKRHYWNWCVNEHKNHTLEIRITKCDELNVKLLKELWEYVTSVDSTCVLGTYLGIYRDRFIKRLIL